jgi:hypothetical protein
MRTLEDARHAFAYHPATPETAPKHAAVRDLFRSTVEQLWALVPDGPEKTLAIRALLEAQMNANLGIALTAPADEGETRATARVLPVEFERNEVGLTPEFVAEAQRMSWGLPVSSGTSFAGPDADATAAAAPRFYPYVRPAPEPKPISKEEAQLLEAGPRPARGRHRCP